tara:strand:+ start:272 stop:1894 length:1623 start_codon:yes stop_codon:yes gene_type:complete
MDAFDKLVEKHFSKNPLNVLMEMVEKELDGFVPKEVLKEVRDFSNSIMDLMPKLEISEEAWGRKDTEENPNEARRQFQLYMDNVEGDDIENKLRYLNLFAQSVRPEKYEVHEVLSNIMFLDLLSTVVNNFSPSGSGFLFEAFLAGLLRGTQQIEKAGGELQIDDLRDAEDKPISLKLLVPTTNVKGSIKNLIGFLANPGNDSIEYLCVYKFGKEKTSSIAFYSFIIDPYNIYYWLADTFKLKIELAENQRARRTQKQQLSKKQINDIMNAQADAKGMMNFALASRARGREKALNKLLDPMAKKAIKKIQKAGGELKFQTPDYFLQTDDELESMSEEGLAAVIEFRKDFVTKIRKTYAPPEHELGQYRDAYKSADIQWAEEKDRDYFIYLYEENPELWANELLALAGQKALSEPEDVQQGGFEFEPESQTISEAKDKTQFEIKSNLIIRRQLPEVYQLKRLGNLSIDREKTLELAAAYTEKLQESVVAIFTLLDSLTKGITGYYLTPEKGGNRFQYGQQAAKASADMSALIADPELGLEQK